MVFNETVELIYQIIKIKSQLTIRSLIRYNIKYKSITIVDSYSLQHKHASTQNLLLLEQHLVYEVTNTGGCENTNTYKTRVHTK